MSQYSDTRLFRNRSSRDCENEKEVKRGRLRKMASKRTGEEKDRERKRDREREGNKESLREGKKTKGD